MFKRNRRVALVATAVVLGVLASGCGSDDNGGDATSPQSGGPTTTLQPRTGGTLTFGSFTEPPGLDPIVALGHGTAGGDEMAAVYDTILRWNPDTAKYDNRTAESVSSNPEFTEWTLKIKPNIKFSDGTDYDAEAVKLGMNRHRSGVAGAPACETIYACPRNGTTSTAYMSLIKDIQAVDKLTVKFVLNEPWSTFTYALSAEPSMIPSPTALKKCDPTKPANTCEFNLKPVGAGPFMVESFKAKDSITMVRNPNYWNGPVYLDGLRIVNLGDQGGVTSYEAVKTGQLQGAHIKDPAAVSAAHADKMPGFSTFDQSSLMFLINTGSTVQCVGGKPEPHCVGLPDGPTVTNPPTKNVKVRQAIAAAIDPKVIDQRSTNGKGYPGNELLQSDFRWYPGPNGPKYDPAAAAQLVKEAKAEGWNGKLRLLYNNASQATSVALATEAMLETAGMDVTVDISKDPSASITTVTSKDFDIAGWGMALGPDDSAIWGLTSNLLSTSASNRIGYKNATVDQALKDLRVATTDDQRKALYKKIADQLAIDVPILPWAKAEQFPVFSPKVHGVAGGNRALVFFDKAWLEA